MNRRVLKVALGLAVVAVLVTIGSRTQLARAQSQESTVFSVPKSYGTVRAIDIGSGGPIFEAPDGTVRYVDLRRDGQVSVRLTIRRQ